MFDIKVLNKEETEILLRMPQVISVVEKVYESKSEGNSVVFPLIFHEFDPGVADMDIKSGWLKGSDIFGLKVVSWFGENPQKGLPALIGTVMIFDATTGAPVGILDGAHITGMRTGAAGAIGVKLLARKDSENLLMVGTGHIAPFLIAATLIARPNLKKIMIYSPRNFNNAEKLAGSIRGILAERFGITRTDSIVFEAVNDIKSATEQSDIILTATPSREPIIKKEWVKIGTHISCMGADMSGKEEIDPAIFRDARTFVDDIKQCIHVGEIEIPVARGFLREEDLAGEIGDILTGKTVARENQEQITVFDSTGTALLDLLTGKLAIEEAEKAGIGTLIKL